MWRWTHGGSIGSTSCSTAGEGGGGIVCVVDCERLVKIIYNSGSSTQVQKKNDD
ncbi:MAG: hypothetical protein LBF12_07580 [Christensenellaceae bacterium]|jgi:hypothetical protein|nr:hypothetical protein [Christensenellaceae bacterium]